MSKKKITEDILDELNLKLNKNNLENVDKNYIIVQQINEIYRNQKHKIVKNYYMKDKFSSVSKILGVEKYLVYDGTEIHNVLSENIKTKLNQVELYKNIGKNIKYVTNDILDLETTVGKNNIVDSYKDITIYGKIIGISELLILVIYNKSDYEKKTPSQYIIDYKNIVTINESLPNNKFFGR